MLTVKQMASKLNRSTTRVLQLIREGKFPGARKNGRSWLIPEPKSTKSSPAAKPPILTAKQRKQISERTKTALAEARAAGRRLGRPPKLTPKKKEAASKR